MLNYYCPKCGRDIIDGTNSQCCRCSYYMIPQPTIYNYKCPECQGEFNAPIINAFTTSNLPTYKCPFCGRKMQGMSNG